MPDGKSFFTNEKLIAIKLYISGVISTSIVAFGADYKYLTLLLVLMLADTVVGWLKGFKLGVFSSARAKWGFAGKIVELGIVYIMGRLDWTFGTGHWLANTGALYYGIVEIASIIENIQEGGLAVLPAGLSEFIHKLKYSAGKALVTKLGRAFITALGITPETPQEQDQGQEQEQEQKEEIHGNH